MMTSFYKSFREEENTQIPKEILDELSNELPSNFMYVQDIKGNYSVAVRPEYFSQNIRFTTQFDLDPDKDAILISKLKKIPPEKLPEYFYRTQREIPVKNVRIGNDEQLIPLAQTEGNPLKPEESTVVETRMYPESFPDPISMSFESEDGDKETIHFQQQPLDSLTEIKFENIDFPALKIEMFLYSPITEAHEEDSKTNKDNPVNITYSVTPTKATTVTEAVKALHFFSGIFMGTIKINGKMMTPKIKQTDFQSEKLEDALSFWTTALELEKKIGVKFDPSADFPAEDVRFFKELDICLNHKKQILWDHPFDSFHLNNVQKGGNTNDIERLIGTEEVKFRFIEGPLSATLLGAEFEIFSLTEMMDLIVSNIRWDDETKRSGEIYILDAPGRTWKLKRMYMTRKDVEKLQKEL